MANQINRKGIAVKNEKHSPVMEILARAWNASMKATGHSYTRLNGGMRVIMGALIEADTMRQILFWLWDHGNATTRRCTPRLWKCCEVWRRGLSARRSTLWPQRKRWTGFWLKWPVPRSGCVVRGRTYAQGSTVSPYLAAHLCLLADAAGYRASCYTWQPKPGKVGDRQIKTARLLYCMYFYPYQEKRRGHPTRMEHEGITYSLRPIKVVERIPYEGDVWNISVAGNPSFMTRVGISHNTEKPVELAARAIEYSSLAGENILDLFGGSGSTLIAAEQIGRKAYLMELDMPYCDVIVARYEKFTGKRAVRIPNHPSEGAGIGHPASWVAQIRVRTVPVDQIGVKTRSGASWWRFSYFFRPDSCLILPIWRKSQTRADICQSRIIWQNTRISPCNGFPS